MDAFKKTGQIVINFNNDEAIVLLELVSSINAKDQGSLFQDQAEERLLFDLEAVLEKVMPEIFDSDYNKIVARARNNIRDHP